MYIRYESIIIRDALSSDVPHLLRWWNDGAVMAHAGFPGGLGTTEEKVAARIEKGLLYIIEYEGVPIGEMNYRPVGASAEIGIKICEAEYRNRGIGRKILSLFIKELFRMGFEKIVLDTNLENKRAQHVYESLGFKKVGVNIDSWRDGLGNLQSSVDYELSPQDLISFL